MNATIENTSNWFATRAHPEAAGLEAALVHAGGWKALSITSSPQTLELTLTNRTPLAVEGESAHIRLLFRPGILDHTDALALAPQSEGEWVLGTTHDDSGFLTVNLYASVIPTLAPGASLIVRIAGVSVSSAGGSRATRVQVGYNGFWQRQAEDDYEVAGISVVRLPLLRRHAPESLKALPERASTAIAGPLFAGILEGRTLLNDGISPNHVNIRLLNISGQPLPLSSHDDEATRIGLTWRTGSVSSNWGLLGASESHLLISEFPRGWQVERHSLQCIEPQTLSPGGYMDISVQIHTTANDGEAQLTLMFENLPGYDDGDLHLPFQLGVMSLRNDAMHLLKPLELRGADASVKFAPAGENGSLLDTEKIPAISADRSLSALGRLNIHAPNGVKLDGALNVDTSITSSSMTAKGGIQADTVNAKSLTITGWTNLANLIASSLKVTSHTNLEGLSSSSLTVSGGTTLNSVNTNSLTVKGETRLKNLNTLSLTVRGSSTLKHLSANSASIDHNLTVKGNIYLSHGWYIDVTDGGSQLQFRKDGKTKFLIGSDGGTANISGDMRRITG